MIEIKVAVTTFVIGVGAMSVVSSFTTYAHMLPNILWLDVLAATAFAAMLTRIWRL